MKVTCSNMKNTKGHYTQNMAGYFTYTIPQAAYIQITKKIANTDCTVGNSNYSVTGTVYKIYKTAKKAGYVGTLTIGSNGLSNIVNGTGEQTIVDEIEYKGLEKNVEHVAKTWLVDSNGNKLDVPEVETKFTPNAATGKVKVEITFDASKYAGTNVIVFEEVYLQGQIIAEHKDTDDDNQTVQVSKIQTSATGKTLRNNMIPSKGKQVIEDAVDYENLPAGEPVTINSDSTCIKRTLRMRSWLSV